MVYQMRALIINVNYISLLQHKTDDEDSGNDEPTDLPTDFKDFGFHGQSNSHMNSPNCEAAPKRVEPLRIPVPLLKIDRFVS